MSNEITDDVAFNKLLQIFEGPGIDPEEIEEDARAVLDGVIKEGHGGIEGLIGPTIGALENYKGVLKHPRATDEQKLFAAQKIKELEIVIADLKAKL